MEMAGLTVSLFEAEPPFTEVDLAGNAGLDHPLQSAVDGGAADAAVFLPHQVHEVIGAEVPLLTKEDGDDLLALAGALAARRLQLAEIR